MDRIVFCPRNAMRPARHPASLLCIALLAAGAEAQGAGTLPHLVAAQLGSAPVHVQSGGIAACEATLDDRGQVTAVDVVQDLDPYGAILAGSVRSWQFEPARVDGRAVASSVLVLGFFRPPTTSFVAPAAPRYKTTTAPEQIPWPTSVTVPPYPPNVLGSGGVILEVDVSEDGAVTGTRVMSPAGAFDGAAAEAVQKWTFRPARQQGRGVPSRVFMVVTFIGTTP
jgi:TonB family protein